MGIEKKVEEMAQLIADMVDPLHSAVKEIEASTRSRKLVLRTMLASVVVMAVASLYVTMKMERVADRLDKMIIEQAVTRVELSLTQTQLQELTDLALKGARSGNVAKLEKIMKITQSPEPAVFRAAIKKLSAPSVSAQYLLSSAPAIDTNTGTNTDAGIE